MTKLRKIQPRSFLKSRYFPGTAGNPFDTILQSADKFANLPDIALLICLIFLSWLGGKYDWAQARILLLFIGVDWLLLALLPVTKRSYGPVKPVVLMLAILRTPFMLLPFPWGLSVEVIGTILVIYGFYFEPFNLDVHYEVFITPKWQQNASISIAHLGDLHIERLTRREEKILQELEKAKPDLILFSGDILNLSCVNDVQSQKEASQFFKSLHAPLGVYGVTGSPPVDPPAVYQEIIDGSPLRWLDDEKVIIKTGESTLTLTGLTCSHHPDDDFDRLEQKGSIPVDSGSLNIFLYHSPDIAPLIQTSGFDLQLSGHTHGGQVRLPFYGAIFAASLYHKAFEAGRYLLGKMTLYVTRGLGMEGGIAPRVRFLCRPELIFWEIKSS